MARELESLQSPKGRPDDCFEDDSLEGVVHVCRAIYARGGGARERHHSKQFNYCNQLIGRETANSNRSNGQQSRHCRMNETRRRDIGLFIRRERGREREREKREEGVNRRWGD